MNIYGRQAMTWLRTFLHRFSYNIDWPYPCFVYWSHPYCGNRRRIASIRTLL